MISFLQIHSVDAQRGYSFLRQSDGRARRTPQKNSHARNRFDLGFGLPFFCLDEAITGAQGRLCRLRPRPLLHDGDRCARAVVSFSLNFCICSQKEKWLSFTSVREAQKGGKQLPPWSHLPVARATAGGTMTDIEVLCISL